MSYFKLKHPVFFVIVLALFGACTSNTSEKQPPNQVTGNIPDSSDCEKSVEFLRIFKKLTNYKLSVEAGVPKQDISREIQDLSLLKTITDEFQLYAKQKIGIDVSPASNPRLCVGVDFDGATLIPWITRMFNTGATNLVIKFAKYNNNFLTGHNLPAGTQEYINRLDRLTVVLVAYKSSTSPATIIGAYNLGGMEP